MNNNNDSVGWMQKGGIQAHANYRLVLSALIIGGSYLAFSQGIVTNEFPTIMNMVFILIGAYAIGSYLYLQKDPVISKNYLPITLVADVASLSLIAAFIGPISFALFPLYLLITFGYGLPNGEKFLQGASALSTLGFTLVYLATSGGTEPILAMGLLASLFYLPLMVSGYTQEQTQPVAAEVEESEMSAAESEVLTELSHELQTQIKEVVTDTDELLKQGLSAKKQHLTQSIANNSATALRLVKEVDEYARLVSGQHEYEKQQVSLISIVSAVTAICSTEAEKKSLSYEVTFSPEMIKPVETSPKEIRQVLSHLIGNAVKYTDKGYVRLNVSTVEKEEQLYWRYEVSDSGKGVHSDQFGMVFEPFVRADAGRSHHSRGLGLGATIARLLVEGMGGEIGFISEKNKGSTFWFELPITVISNPKVLTEAPLNIVNVSLNPHEKGVCLRLEQEGVIAAKAIGIDELSPSTSLGVDGFLVGEYVSEQELLNLTDTFSDDDLPIALVRYQRLQPDNLIVYTHQKSGDVLSVPESLEAEELQEIFRGLSFRSKEQNKESSSHESKEKLSVLIAEGSSGTRDILATMLVNKGHQIYLARNSIQAQDIINGIDLDLLLLDPELSDEALHVAIEKRSPQSCLLITGQSTSKTVREQFNNFSDGELSKPIQTQNLYQEIERLFGRGETLKEKSFKSDTGYKATRKSLLNIDHKVLNLHALEELEEVDNGNGLLNRFIDRYVEDSEKVLEKLRDAFETWDIQSVKRYSEEFESLSSQLGLEQLAEFCKRIRTIEQADLEKRQEGLVIKLEVLHSEALDALHVFRQNFENR